MKNPSQQFYEEALESSGRCKAFIFAASLYSISDSVFEILAGLAAYYASDAAKWVRLSKQFEEMEPSTACWRWGQPSDPFSEQCKLPAYHSGPCITEDGPTLPVYR